MNGFLSHLWMTVRLNFRNMQALIFGYIVPIVFLIILTSAFGPSTRPSITMSRVLTITALGGACFGMPVALVSERERGVWRRLKLVPLPIVWFILSTIVARYLIVITSGILQVAIGMLIYKWPMPAHPFELFIAYSFTTFAFLGLGLIIAMLANSPLAVQYMGNLIFLPMIAVGGVGMNFSSLPKWAPHVANFTPGLYAVDSMKICFSETDSLQSAWFALVALTVAGVACCVAAAALFRWAPEQKPRASAKWWALLALAAWLSTGAYSEFNRPAPKNSFDFRTPGSK